MTYALPDDPRPGPLTRRACGHIWPALTLMLAGPLMGFVWLAVNAHALGCRNAWRQSALAFGVFAGAKLGAVALLMGWTGGALGGVFGAWDDLAVRLGMLVLVGAQLALALWMMMAQARAENLRGHFGPPLAKGAGVFAGCVVLGFVVVPRAPGVVQFLFGWQM